jgi:hypothetical protein
MATIMPPWSDWLEYLGADAIGRVIGLWFNFCMSLVKDVFRLLTRTAGNLGSSAVPLAKPDNLPYFDATLRKNMSPFRRLNRIVTSTLVTLVVWRIVTLKAVWVAAGESGDQILTAILLFVSASWVISLGWICFSNSKQTEIPAATTRPLRKPGYTGSTSTRAS